MDTFLGTKGDWRLSNDLMEVTVSRIGILEETKSIANIKDFGKTEEEWNANAKLIVSAPDLLKALKEMVRMYEIVEPAGGWQGVYEMSTYAIKKATE